MALESADRQAGGSPNSRVHVGQCHNSRIHESRSSTLACARVVWWSAWCTCAGAVSAARGSACLPAVRTRSCADVAASACGACLCRSPAVTTWMWVGRVPRGGRVPKVGFPVRPKVCSLSLR